MEQRIIQLLLLILGVTAIVIAVVVFVLGEKAIYLLQGGFEAMLEQTISPTIDSAFRFYTTYWFAYGVTLVWVARRITQRIQFTPFLMAVFFASGIGRLISLIVVGAPHPMFTVLMVIELVYPILIIGLYLRLKR